MKNLEVDSSSAAQDDRKGLKKSSGIKEFEELWSRKKVKECHSEEWLFKP